MTRACFTVAVRVVALLVALQVSGLVACAVGDCCSSADDLCNKQSNDPCNDCPPGAPCHCNPTDVGLPPPVTITLACRDYTRPVVWQTTIMPSDPPRSSLYRPPAFANSV